MPAGGFARAPGQRDDLGLSDELWLDCPYEEILRDRSAGYYFRDNFVDLPTGKYTATQATAGTFALIDGEGGIVEADSASTTATQGINVQTPKAFVLPKAGAKIWFEARLKAKDIATGPEFFLGLSEIDTTIIASSANSSANHIGFESVTDDGILLFHGEKAGTRGSLTTPHTLVDDTFVKLGFKVTELTKVEVYVDGVLFSETVVTANIPIVALAPSLVLQSGGTTDPLAEMDWWECFVEARS